MSAGVPGVKAGREEKLAQSMLQPQPVSRNAPVQTPYFLKPGPVLTAVKEVFSTQRELLDTKGKLTEEGKRKIREKLLGNKQEDRPLAIKELKTDSTADEDKDKTIAKLKNRIHLLEAEMKMMKEQNAEMLNVIECMTQSVPLSPPKIELLTMPRLVLGGLPNIRNSCYMNAVIQALLASPKFVAALPLNENTPPLVRTLHTIANVKENLAESSRLYSSLQDLQKILNADKTQPDLYNERGRTQDSATVFEAILELMPFRPTMRTTYSAGPEVKSSILSETLATIIVPIYAGQTLQQIVDSEYTTKAQDDSKNPWTATLKQGGDRQLTAYTITRQLAHPAPELLVLQFPRKDYRTAHYNALAIACPLDTPLDMTHAFGGNDSRYRLVACVNHHHPRVHYSAFVLKDGKWYHCDDSAVLEIAHPPLETSCFLILEKLG